MTRSAALGLLLRGLWWRRGLSAALLGVAVVTTTAAALGPLYARAAGESILQDHLIQGGSDAGLRQYTDVELARRGALARVESRVLKPGAIKGYNRQIPTLYTDQGVVASLPRGFSGAVKTHLVWREGACAHLVIVHGHCPTGPGQALASERTIDVGVYHWKLGALLPIGAQANQDEPWLPLTKWPAVRIVGTYRPRNPQGPFWFGQDYFDQRPGDPIDTVDALFVPRSEFFAQPVYLTVEASFTYPVTAHDIRLNDLPAEKAALSTLLRNHPALGFNLPVESKILDILGAAAQERHQVDIAMLLVTLQLGLLAWLVLFQVVSDASEARGDEVAMAKLRGYSPRATARFGLGEPLALIALAVPIGLVLAVVVTHAFAASILVPGVPVLVTASPVVAALVAFAGGAVAAGLAAQRTLSRSVLDQWRRTERRPGHGKLALAADLAVAAAAVAGLVLIRRSSTGSPHGAVTLIAPGLLVLAVAVIGVRLVPLACRWLARATRASARMGIFLASRQVSRRPLGLRLCAFLAVAVGLATFAVAGESIAATNRSARADAEIGAPRVATVEFNAGLDPVTATARADPDGRWAMAAATWLPDGGDSVVGTVLGVDSSRLAAVGSAVSGGLPNTKLASLLSAGSQPPIIVHTTRMRVRLTVTGLRGDVPPAVQLNFRTALHPFVQAEGGSIRPGSHDYDIAVPCRAGCRLRGLTWDRPVLATGVLQGTVTLHGLDVAVAHGWQPLDIRLGHRVSWFAKTPLGQASDAVSVTPSGVVDRFRNDNGGYGGISYGSAPTPMPAVATRAGMATDPSAPRVPAVTDALTVTAQFVVKRYVPVLPVVGGAGVVMDVRFLEDELPAFASEAIWQVWLGAHAPPDAIQRLTAAGLQVVAVTSQQHRIDELARQGPALALLLLLACAVAGAVLALGATATSISAGGRRRSYELAALRVVGVRRPVLLGAGVIEQLLLLGSALLLGLPTGLVAARLAMPLIPEFADATPITLHYTPQAAPTTLLAVALIVLLVATAAAGAWASLRVAVPSRLREAE